MTNLKMNLFAALAITGAMQRTSRDNIYQELGLESLKSRTWYRRLNCIFKIMRKEAPNHLINLIPNVKQPSEQEIAIFRLTIVERTVSSIRFFLLL